MGRLATHSQINGPKAIQPVRYELFDIRPSSLFGMVRSLDPSRWYGNTPCASDGHRTGMHEAHVKVKARDALVEYL